MWGHHTSNSNSSKKIGHQPDMVDAQSWSRLTEQGFFSSDPGRPENLVGVPVELS